jgi:hypothetical protein
VDFSLKIGYMGSLKFSCYYLQYVLVSEPFDYALFEVLEASNTVLYLIRLPVISRQDSFVNFSKDLLEGPSQSGKLASG